MTSAEKIREDRVRRMLARQGCQLTKSRRRDPRASDFGLYAILDWRNSVFPAAYDMTLDDAEKCALDGERPVKDWEQVGEVGAGWLGLAEVVPTPGGGPYPVRVLRDSDGSILSVKVDLSASAPS
jgi:hypothetical protein